MPDRWRLGSRNPFTVYRVADGAHDVEHAREHFVTSFRREEDARRAVDAVNAQAERIDLDYPAGRWRDVYVRVHGDKEVATTEQITDTIRVDWSAPNAAGDVDIVGVEVVAATGVEVDGDPAGSAVGQRGAPTRDARGEAEAVAKAFGRLCGGDDGASWDDEKEIAVPREWVRRAYRLALAALRDGGAGTGGERAVPTLTMVAPFADCGFCGAPLADLCAPMPDGTMACSARCVDLSRLARAAGVDPDAADPVGEIERVIREGREVEVVTGPDAVKLPATSIVVQCEPDGTPFDFGDVCGVDQGFDDWLRHRRWVRVLYRAPVHDPAPAPAALVVGEVVTGDRALAAPVGTKLGAKNAAVAAVRTTGGWSVTGMNHEQDHEHAVRINEWVVLALGGES